MNNKSTTSYTGPFITMVFLFFIVGFLTVVNQQFQSPLQHALLKESGSIKNVLTVLITFSWFLSYPLTGGIAAKLVNKHGYKSTMIRALLLMIFGLAIFEASVLYQQYIGTTVSFGSVTIPVAFFIFLLGSYTVGAAVTIMQVVINPYLVASKVKGTSDVQRLTIGGTSNSIGTTLAPFFVGGIIFGGHSIGNIGLSTLTIPFIGLMITIAIVTLVVKNLSLPDIAGTTTKGSNEKLERSIWSFRHLALGVVAIFIYVGVEVCVGANIKLHAESLGGKYLENTSWFGVQVTLAALMASTYWLLMLVGRIIGAFLNKIPAKPQLVFTSIAAMILLAIAMITSNPWFLVATGLCHSIMWPAIFPLAIKGLGKYTSAGTGALMIGVLGGGVLPLMQAAMADIGGWDWTWSIVIIGEVYLLYYALVGHKIRKGDNME